MIGPCGGTHAMRQTSSSQLITAIQIGALGSNLNALMRTLAKKQAGQSGRRPAGTVLIFSRN